MRITIKAQGERTIRIIFPTRLFFNGFIARIGAGIVNKHVPENEIKLNGQDLRRLMKEFRRMKQKYPNLYLAEVESSDGDIVTIKL